MISSEKYNIFSFNRFSFWVYKLGIAVLPSVPTFIQTFVYSQHYKDDIVLVIKLDGMKCIYYHNIHVTINNLTNYYPIR